jgi:hypothetical protein
MQIEQDIQMCKDKFKGLLCIPVAAQFMDNEKIALLSFEKTSEEQIKILSERHYKLVPADSLTSAEIDTYNKRVE